jgi:hypothetical protein
MLPHPDHHHRRVPDIVMRCPRLLPLLANCFSSGVMHSVLQTVIYMYSQRVVSSQLSGTQVETFPPHLSDIVPCSPEPSFDLRRADEFWEPEGAYSKPAP